MAVWPRRPTGSACWSRRSRPLSAPWSGHCLITAVTTTISAFAIARDPALHRGVCGAGLWLVEAADPPVPAARCRSASGALWRFLPDGALVDLHGRIASLRVLRGSL